MKVFVDTSAVLALSNRQDYNHSLAANIWQRLVGEKHELLTTNYVLVEACTLLQTRIGLHVVREFQSEVAPLLSVVWIDEEQHKVAVQALLLANLRRLSLVDCSSMTVARQLDITHFFAFDRHFTERGFTCLLA